eukprot:TRINITY_DN17653_c0_g1_i2.p1 TRINITY_DN17653_c0_g1~~TRINITY_DN17653_c0_g1_i2.p1  ORF type:complete len:1049 (+),score=187.03 TRINITY_DN17653_c0_g1_i2:177-3323(+)
MPNRNAPFKDYLSHRQVPVIASTDHVARRSKIDEDFGKFLPGADSLAETQSGENSDSDNNSVASAASSCALWASRVLKEVPSRSGNGLRPSSVTKLRRSLSQGGSRSLPRTPSTLPAASLANTRPASATAPKTSASTAALPRAHSATGVARRPASGRALSPLSPSAARSDPRSPSALSTSPASPLSVTPPVGPKGCRPASAAASWKRPLSATSFKQTVSTAQARALQEANDAAQEREDQRSFMKLVHTATARNAGKKRDKGGVGSSKKSSPRRRSKVHTESSEGSVQVQDEHCMEWANKVLTEPTNVKSLMKGRTCKEEPTEDLITSPNSKHKRWSYLTPDAAMSELAWGPYSMKQHDSASGSAVSCAEDDLHQRQHSIGSSTRLSTRTSLAGLPAGFCRRLSIDTAEPEVESRPPEAPKAKALKAKERKVDVFMRLQVDQEVDKEQLVSAILFLGHCNPEEKWIKTIADSLSGYSALSVDEFMMFVEQYEDMANEMLEEHFRRLDLDGSGRLDTSELFLLLEQEAGVKLSHVTAEIMDEFDVTRDGELNFEEFQSCVTTLRTREWFTLRELQQYTSVFDRYDLDKSRTLSQPELFGALNWLGYAAKEEDLVKIVTGLHIKEELRESGFLSCMRKVYNNDINRVQRLCSQSCSMSPCSKLMLLLRSLGYNPLHEVVLEVMQETDVPNDRSYELHLEGVMAFLTLYRGREGLSRALTKEITQAIRAATEGDEYVSVRRVGQVLWRLGWDLPWDVRQAFVIKVDVDQSGTLDLTEMLKLVRFLLVKLVVDPLTKTFAVDSIAKKDRGDVHTSLMPFTRRIAGSAAPQIVYQAMRHDHAGYSLPDYLSLGRKIHEKERKWSCQNFGFARGEVEKLEAMFKRFDMENRGQLEGADLRALLTEALPVLAGCVLQRPQLLELLEVAGVRTKDCPLKFRNFLHLMRLAREAEDQTCWHKEMEATRKTQFSVAEVDKLRDLFLHSPDGENRQRITLDDVVKLFSEVYALGAARENELLVTYSHIAGSSSAEADFPDFLLIMKRLIDSDFAGCRSAV